MIKWHHELDRDDKMKIIKQYNPAGCNAEGVDGMYMWLYEAMWTNTIVVEHVRKVNQFNKS